MAVPHSVRVALTIALVALLMLGGLFLLKRGSPSPARRLVRVSLVSVTQPTTSAGVAPAAEPTRQCADHDSDGDADDTIYNFAASIIPPKNPFRNAILNSFDFDHDACRPPSGA